MVAFFGVGNGKIFAPGAPPKENIFTTAWDKISSVSTSVWHKVSGLWNKDVAGKGAAGHAGAAAAGGHAAAGHAFLGGLFTLPHIAIGAAILAAGAIVVKFLKKMMAAKQVQSTAAVSAPEEEYGQNRPVTTRGAVSAPSLGTEMITMPKSTPALTAAAEQRTI